MTENLAGRGEGLAGLVAAIEMEATLLVGRSETLANNGEAHRADILLARGRELEGVASRVKFLLEAAAPAGTDGICPICYHSSAALATPSPQAPASKLGVNQFIVTKSIAEDGQTINYFVDGKQIFIGNEAPPEQSNAFSTTSAREQSSATASGNLSAAKECELREFLWTHHGHGGISLYGDDGEMQCHHCKLWDYKREPLDVLIGQAAVTAQEIKMERLQWAAKELAVPAATQEPAGSGATQDDLQRAEHTHLRERLMARIAHAIRFEVKESDGAHWEYSESEFEALMTAIRPAADSALVFTFGELPLSPRKVGEDGQPEKGFKAEHFSAMFCS